MIQTWLKRSGALAVLAMGLAATGCSSDISGQSVRANMSPEMETVQYTHEQRCNNIARTVNTNLRGIHDEWDRAWLLDQPMKSSYIPIP